MRMELRIEWADHLGHHLLLPNWPRGYLPRPGESIFVRSFDPEFDPVEERYHDVKLKLIERSFYDDVDGLRIVLHCEEIAVASAGAWVRDAKSG